MTLQMRKKIELLALVFEAWGDLDSVLDNTASKSLALAVETAQDSLDKVIVNLAQDIVDLYRNENDV